MKIILHIAFLLSVLPIYAQYQLDSVIYKSEDRLIKTSQQRDPSSNMWWKENVQTYTKTNAYPDHTRQWSEFDQSENEILSIFSHWNPLTNVWENNDKIEKKFDSQNRLVLASESVHTDNEWLIQALDTVLYTKDSIVTISYIRSEPSSKNVGLLDAEGNEFSSINYNWDAESKVWDLWMKTDFAYVRDSILQESRTYLWKDGNWLPSEKTAYIFDDDTQKSTGSVSYIGSQKGWQPQSKTARKDFPEKRMRTDTLYVWSVEKEHWHPDLAYVNYFDEQNKETDYLVLKVNKDSYTTEVMYEQKNMYNDQGEITLRQEINFENSKPVKGYQQTYRLDENANIVQYTTWELDIDTDQWAEKSQTDFSMHPDILYSSDSTSPVVDIFQLGIYNRNKNIVSEAKVYYFDKGNKKLHEHALFYYSSTNTNR